jgi:hypothetical protein
VKAPNKAQKARQEAQMEAVAAIHPNINCAKSQQRGLQPDAVCPIVAAAVEIIQRRPMPNNNPNPMASLLLNNSSNRHRRPHCKDENVGWMNEEK